MLHSNPVKGGEQHVDQTAVVEILEKKCLDHTF